MAAINPFYDAILNKLRDGTSGGVSLDTKDTQTLALAVLNNVLSGNVRISAAANNMLSALPDGLYAVSTSFEGVETPSIIVDIRNNKISASLILSTVAGNTLTINSDGLYAKNVLSDIKGDPDGIPISTSFENNIIKATLKLSSVQNNLLKIGSDGLYAIQEPVNLGSSSKNNRIVGLNTAGDLIDSGFIINPTAALISDNTLVPTQNIIVNYVTSTVSEQIDLNKLKWAVAGTPTPDISGQEFQVTFSTLAAYNSGAHQPNMLYFVDDGTIHLGDIYLGGLKSQKVTGSFPASPEENIIYWNSATHEIRTWEVTSGTGAWNTWTLPTTTDISANNTNNFVPTCLAVSNAIAKAIGSLTAGVSSIDWVPASGSLKVVQDGQSKDIQLVGLFSGVSYNAATGDLSFSTNGGTPVVINIPKENFLTNASYDPATHILTLTFVDGSTTSIDLSDLVDTITVQNSNTVRLTLGSDGLLTANVRLDPDESNELVALTNGLYVSVSNDLMQKVPGTNGTLITADTFGNTQRTTFKPGNAVPAAEDEATTLVAYSVIKEALDKKLNYFEPNNPGFIPITQSDGSLSASASGISTVFATNYPNFIATIDGTNKYLAANYQPKTISGNNGNILVVQDNAISASGYSVATSIGGSNTVPTGAAVSTALEAYQTKAITGNNNVVLVITNNQITASNYVIINRCDANSTDDQLSTSKSIWNAIQANSGSVTGDDGVLVDILDNKPHASGYSVETTFSGGANKIPSSPAMFDALKWMLSNTALQSYQAKFRLFNDSESLQTDNILNGVVSITQDTLKAFLDWNNTRFNIDSIIEVELLSDLPPTGLPNKLYHVTTDFNLYFYTNGQWVGVLKEFPTPAMVSVSVQQTEPDAPPAGYLGVWILPS